MAPEAASKLGTLGTAAFKIFFSSPGLAGVRRRPRRSETRGERHIRAKKVAPISNQLLASLFHTVRIGTSLLRQLAHVEEIGHV